MGNNNVVLYTPKPLAFEGNSWEGNVKLTSGVGDIINPILIDSNSTAPVRSLYVNNDPFSIHLSFHQYPVYRYGDEMTCNFRFRNYETLTATINRKLIITGGGYSGDDFYFDYDVGLWMLTGESRNLGYNLHNNSDRTHPTRKV